MALPNRFKTDMAYKIHFGEAVENTAKRQKEWWQEHGKPRESSGHFSENYVYVATHKEVYFPSFFTAFVTLCATRNFGENCQTY